MNTGNRTCCIENLEARRLLSASVELGEAEPIQLQHSDIRQNSSHIRFVSDGNGLVVRSLGGDANGVWRIALYRHIGDGSGAGVEQPVDLPGARADTSVNMAINGSGQLVISWRVIKPDRSAEIFLRVYQIDSSLALTPITAARSIASARSYTELWSPAEAGIDNAGNVTATWTQIVANTSDVLARRYLKSNNYKGEKSFTVHGDKRGTQRYPNLALDQQSGSAFLGWGESDSYFVQKFDNAGRRIGGEIKILDRPNAGLVSNPSDGGFVAHWGKRIEDVSITRTFQYFSAAAAKQGQAIDYNHHPIGLDYASDEILPNGDRRVIGTEITQGPTSVAVDASGNLAAFYSRWDRAFDWTVSPDGSESLSSIEQMTIIAYHYGRSAATLSDPITVASSEATWFLSAGPNWSNYVETGEGNHVAIGNVVAIGGGRFLLPYMDADVNGSPFPGPLSGDWYARTLVPATAGTTSSAGFSSTSTASRSLFSQTPLEDDQSLLAVLQ